MNKKSLIAALLTSVALSALTLMLSSCGKAKPELHIYNWSDYFAQDTLKNFEEKYDCRVVYDVFESNEAMYAKLKAGASGYDVVFPSSYQAMLMDQEGMIEHLDHAKLPNIKYIDPKFLKVVALDKDMAYSLPYMTGTSGFAVNVEKVGAFEPSWSIYDRTDLKGRMTLLNDYREVIGGALKYLGYSLNTTDPKQIAEAGAVVTRWKKNIAKFASDEYKPGIASGEFYVSLGFSGDIMQVVDGDKKVYVLPKEGFSFWSDDIVIPKDAPNKDLAYAFINYLTDPEVAAKNMESNYFMAPNTGAYDKVSKEMREDPLVFIPDDIMAHGEQIRPLGEGDKLYMDAWTKIKSEE